MILCALRHDFISAADRAAVERCIAYCQGRTAGRRESYKAEAAIKAFAFRYGLSLDWLFDSNPKAA
jgi:hypothetical protein